MDSSGHLGVYVNGSENAPCRPRSTLRVDDGEDTRTSERDDSTGVGALKGVTVLLVEDDPLTLEALELILTHHGARVLCAATAEEALDLYDVGELSILISDIGLPGVDGCTLLRVIRTRETGGQHIPAIALSGYPSRETGPLAHRAGFDAFLSKPVPLPVLLRTIDQVAPRRR
jgi:two-component system CheB/CheR fusion protein